MKLPKWKLKLMEDLIKGKVTLVKTRMGYQYKTKTKKMKNINEALDYEIKSHWLASYISFGWGQEIIAWWIANKVKRKWKRYLWAENTRMKIINQNKDDKK